MIYKNYLTSDFTSFVQPLAEEFNFCRPNSGGIAANEKGLAFVGELAFRQPITEAQ